MVWGDVLGGYVVYGEGVGVCFWEVVGDGEGYFFVEVGVVDGGGDGEGVWG